MVIVGGLPLDAALRAIDLHVVTLLFGILLIAAYLQDAGFFRLCAYLVLTRARSARTLLFGLTFVAGALSALLLNDTVCVLLTPLVVAVAVEARLPALPYLLALASAALAAFAGMALLGISLADAAMSAAAALMLVARTPPRRAFAAVDWQLLVFFAGLFVLVAGIARVGVLDRLFAWLAPAMARGDAA